MTGLRPLGRDERGLNTSLTHALTLSITAILIIGLVSTTTGFFGSQREQVAREELRTIGNRIASDAMQATSLADRGGATNITTEHPESVAGTDYSVEVLTGSDCQSGTVSSDTCLRLRATDLSVSIVVPVYNETGFDIDPRQRGTFRVTTRDSVATTATRASDRIRDVDTSSQVGVGVGIDRISAVSLTQPGNQPPDAQFDFTPGKPHNGTSITFDASGSGDPDGTIQEYRWYFPGNDTPVTRNTPTITWEPTDSGQQTVRLVVWDGVASDTRNETIDVSGLAYLNDLDTVSDDDTAQFTLRNDFDRTLRLRQIYVNPADDGIDRLDEEEPISEVGLFGEFGTRIGYVDFGDGIDIRSGGEFISLGEEGTNGGFVELDPDETATVQLHYFNEPVLGEQFTLGAKYELESSSGGYSGLVNTTVFTDTVGRPDVRNFGASASDGDITVSFEATEQLTDITVELTGPDDLTLTEGDFTESGTGPYSYTGTAAGVANGTYTVEMTEAKVGSTPTGERPSDSVLVGGGGALVWRTPSDWDNATLDEGSVVHADIGTHSAGSVEMGYPDRALGGSGLVSYWPLDRQDGDTATDAAGSNDGDIEGGPTVVGGIGASMAYEFDGTDDYVEVPDSSSLEMADENAVTVSTWVYKGTPQAGQQWVAMFQHSDRSYNLQFNNGNEPEFTIYDSGWTDAGGDAIGSEEWVHVVGTFDGDRIRVYENGQQVDDACLAGEAGNSGNCKGGGQMSSASSPAGIAENIDEDGRHLEGRLDELRLYNRALSADEVERLHDAFTQSQFTTATRTADSGSLDGDQLQVEYDVANTSDNYVEVRVRTDDGDRSDWVTLGGGTGTADVTGLSGVSDDTFGLEVRLVSETDVPTDSPTVNSLGVSES
jgi:hypothetical protein